MLEEIKALEFLSALNRSRRRLREDELAVLYDLAQHPSPVIRSDVAALLVDHYEEKSEWVLLGLTDDPHPLVRTDAVDSLSIGRMEITFARLLDLASHDPAYTVRGCAIHSAYDVLINCHGDSDQTLRRIAAMVEPLLQRETDLWVCTCYYCVLYLCGKREYLQLLLACLDDEDIYVRNSVLDTFHDILDERNAAEIEQALEEYLPLESQEMLIDKMTDLLAMLQDAGEDDYWQDGRTRFW